jgi:hypothetical protein
MDTLSLLLLGIFLGITLSILLVTTLLFLMKAGGLEHGKK